VDAVLPLRHSILRAGREREAAHAKQDALPGTRHLAACANDVVVGVATHFPDDTPLAPERRGERLRGMAVDEAWRGRGVGRALVRAVVDAARDRGADILWANARDSALGFYTVIGFHVEGDGFVDDVMHLGHHVVLASLDELTV